MNVIKEFALMKNELLDFLSFIIEATSKGVLPAPMFPDLGAKVSALIHQIEVNLPGDLAKYEPFTGQELSVLKEALIYANEDFQEYEDEEVQELYGNLLTSIAFVIDQRLQEAEIKTKHTTKREGV